MKGRLAVIWAAIVAAGVAAIGVLTGRRRKRRAERLRAREARRAKKAQRRGQGGGRRTSASARASAPPAGTATSPARATPTASGSQPASPSDPAEASATGGAEGDDLRAIRGLGAVAAEKLRGAGVTTYAQIAAWTPDEAREIALRLELQPGRIASDDWVGQARVLVDARDAGSSGD